MSTATLTKSVLADAAEALGAGVTVQLTPAATRALSKLLEEIDAETLTDPSPHAIHLARALTGGDAVLDDEEDVHSVLPVDPADLPGPYPQLDRDVAAAEGLYLGVREGDTPSPYRYEVLVTGDRLSFRSSSTAGGSR